jgi:putative transposase
LLVQIELIHGRFGYYGAPRIHRALVAKQIAVGRHRVARLMRLHGIRARRGPVKGRPRAAPPARRPEVVDRVRRRFGAPAPNRLWFTDLTVIRTDEGFLRAAVVLDAHSRQVISWATDTYETPKTALRALTEAIQIRRPAPGCVIHSDRGYQGGFKRSSQHPDPQGCDDGTNCSVDVEEDRPGADAFAGAAAATA